MAKSFDQKVVSFGAITSPSQFTPPGMLRADSGEVYRGGANDFNDFDDFNDVFFVFTSYLDTTPEPGATRQIVMPGLRARYFVRARVDYVIGDSLDYVSPTQTWYKRLTVTVTSPSSKDSIVVPAVMGYW